MAKKETKPNSRMCWVSENGIAIVTEMTKFSFRMKGLVYAVVFCKAVYLSKAY